MRYLVLVILVLTCMAATIRIDGAWSPATVAQHVQVAVLRVIEPGKSLLSGLERRLQPPRSTPGDAGWEIRLALPRVMAGSTTISPTTRSDHSSCS